MIKLIQYNLFLENLFLSTDFSVETNVVDLDSFDQIIRASMSIDEMREVGSFFTGQELARKAVALLKEPITINSIILDPACGAGNLLIECSRKLEVKETLSETLSIWGRVLRGYDIHSPFVDAARLRITLEALSRGVKRDCSLEEACSLLSNICVRNALSVMSDELLDVTHIVLNPPFTICESPQENYWKKGKVNSAGVFVDHYIRQLPKGCALSFILPDVLRSGSRYNDFRNFIGANVFGEHIIWGRFNNKTDVDVFIIHGVMERGSLSASLWGIEDHCTNKLSSLFDVRVGPLVAYRDAMIGDEYPYFHAKNSISWMVISDVSEYRKFNGKVLKPPFVLIKRTSSPNDKYRAQGTVIDLNVEVAVENHMIVAIPKSGKLSDCLTLLKVLKSEKVNDYLNQRIRLRHLTVSAVKDIPIK